jgi:sulfite reductase (ferredoxin)
MFMAQPLTYRAPSSLPEDLDKLRQMSEAFQAGAIDAARFQAFRVPQGVYEQREAGTYMLRARLVAGVLTPEQMRVAAGVAARYGNGQLHLTSRQDLQVHGVGVANIHAAVVELTRAGLATKGGGGNTVRNIAACYLAGACPEEVFDVAPYVARQTETLLEDGASFQLPRKYKIAYSGCGKDCAGATVNDLGFVSKIREERRGFSVWVGGGMGSNSRVGKLLEEFVPAEDALRVAEAVKRVFDQKGNRRDRHRARIRYLVEELGFEEFARLYREELAKLPAAEAWQPEATASEGVTVELSPELGVMDAGQMEKLAAVVERYGEGFVHATNWQTVTLRGVAAGAVARLKEEVGALGIAVDEPLTLRHLMSCAGASTCRLGIGLSRGLAGAIREELKGSGLGLDAGATVHISGCPNSCGRHGVASIGLQGAARRAHGRLVPFYVAQLGGHVEEGKTVLATGNLAMPARKVPGFVAALLKEFEASAEAPDFQAYLAAGGRETAARLAQERAGVPEDESYFYDFGATEPFTLQGRGQAECGAGVFDLIGLDLAAADGALAAGRRFAAVAAAARALLVTREQSARDDGEGLRVFERFFVEQELVGQEHAGLVKRAVAAAEAGDPEAALGATAEEAGALVGAVKELYASLSPSLKLPNR